MCEGMFGPPKLPSYRGSIRAHMGVPSPPTEPHSATVARFKKVYEETGGDKRKVCIALDLEASEWVDGGCKAFIDQYLGADPDRDQSRKKRAKNCLDVVTNAGDDTPAIPPAESPERPPGDFSEEPNGAPDAVTGS